MNLENLILELEATRKPLSDYSLSLEDLNELNKHIFKCKVCDYWELISFMSNTSNICKDCNEH